MAEYTAKKVFVYPRKDHVVNRTEGAGNLMAAYNKVVAFDAQNIGGIQNNDIKVEWDGMNAPLTISTQIANGAPAKEWLVRVVIPGTSIDSITLTQSLAD